MIESKYFSIWLDIEWSDEVLEVLLKKTCQLKLSAAMNRLKSE